MPRTKHQPSDQLADHPQVIRTSATAGGKGTGPHVPNSAFDVPKPTKPKRASPCRPFDVTAIEVHAGVPIPPAGNTRSIYADLLDRMNIGDMVNLTTHQAASLNSAAKRLEVALLIRKLGGGRSGVWRVAPEPLATAKPAKTKRAQSHAHDNAQP